MVDKVGDASAIASIMFGEPEGVVVAPRLHGAKLLAPGFLMLQRRVCA